MKKKKLGKEWIIEVDNTQKGETSFYLQLYEDGQLVDEITMGKIKKEIAVDRIQQVI